MATMTTAGCPAGGRISTCPPALTRIAIEICTVGEHGELSETVIPATISTSKSMGRERMMMGSSLVAHLGWLVTGDRDQADSRRIVEREIGEKEYKGADRSCPLPTRTLCTESMPRCRASSSTLLASHTTAIVARRRWKTEEREEGGRRCLQLGPSRSDLKRDRCGGKTDFSGRLCSGQARIHAGTVASAKIAKLQASSCFPRKFVVITVNLAKVSITIN